MIKIRLTDPSNVKCFSGLLHIKDLLRDYSIDITNIINISNSSYNSSDKIKMV